MGRVTCALLLDPERGEGDMYVTVSKHIGPERGEGDMYADLPLILILSVYTDFLYFKFG